MDGAYGPASATALLAPCAAVPRSPCLRTRWARAHLLSCGRPALASVCVPRACAERNQYLSEYALHRSLLLSPQRVRSAAQADFFFVPFYSRLAYADKVASRGVRRQQANLTQTLHACLRASPWWRRSRGTDHVVAISSTRDPRKLFGAAWPQLRRAITLMIDTADARYPVRGDGRAGRSHRGGTGTTHEGEGGSRVTLPYFVPHFAEDDGVDAAAKEHSICFFGSTTHPVRRRALQALAHVPGARLQLSTFRHFNGSERARQGERERTLSTRATLRRCKLCLVPAGMTPSSRRFYEALVASCVPLIVSDRFEPAFTSLVPVHDYAVRAPQDEPGLLPRVVENALRRWLKLYAAVRAVRSSFIFDLGHRPPRSTATCDATSSLLEELLTRFAHRSAQEGSRSRCLARNPNRL